MKLQQPNEQVVGIASAIGAYALWGVLPVYWKLVSSVPSEEILAHRIVWSFFFMVLILFTTRKLRSFFDEFRAVVSIPKKFLGIAMCSALISVNWLTYIWAVNNGHVIETSLGYYINPLLSVLLGIIVLKEKLNLWQVISFLLAATGVLNMTLNFGAVPWIALLLAATFGLYGLFKKLVNIGAITGITSETLMITPLASIYLSYIHKGGSGSIDFASPVVSGLLIGAGVVTAVPLILFASGANRLPLSIVGFFQYIAPTIALFLGIFLFHEPFTPVHFASFAMIWLALTIFSLAKTRTFIQLESLLIKKMHLKGKGTA